MNTCTPVKVLSISVQNAFTANCCNKCLKLNLFIIFAAKMDKLEKNVEKSSGRFSFQAKYVR